MAIDILAVLGWNACLRYQQGAIHTFSCTTLLGDVWINDEIMSIVVEQTAEELSGPVVLANSLFVSSLCGCTSSGSFGRSGEVKSVEQKIEKTKASSLIFPMHIHHCHWIVGLVDFEHLEIHYGELSFVFLFLSLQFFEGDPLNMASPNDELKALQTWLENFTGHTYRLAGNSLPCAPQKDQSSCGILAFNTIRHHATGAPLWAMFSGGDVALHRISLFLTISENLYKPGATTTNLQSTVVHDNNYPYKIKEEGAEIQVIRDNKSKRVLNVESGQRMALLETEKNMPWWWKKRS
jgi:hypothetical protein